jgi:hypothetical protein
MTWKNQKSDYFSCKCKLSVNCKSIGTLRKCSVTNRTMKSATQDNLTACRYTNENELAGRSIFQKVL